MIAANPQQTTVEKNGQCLRTRIAPIPELLLGLLLLCATVLTSVAGPFTQLVIFGDSLADMGNIAQATADIYPGQYYYNDRFSNGPVFTEGLAAGLGVPLVRSTAGGNNFAYGGARTTGTGGFEGLFIRDIDEQVDQFLATRTSDPGELFVVFAGSNDLVGGQTNMSIPVNSLAEDLGRLIADGARNFLVPNLPLLGYTPRYNGSPTTLATYNTRSQQFNSTLAAMLDGLDIANPAITLYRFDVAAMFNQALADPASFGLTNVTQSAAPGLEPGASSYDTNQIAPNANEYMFWDDLHPTATVHSVLAERMLELFSLPGDFNLDGSVDAADYVVWRRGFGTTYTPADYDLWREHFGETAGGAAAHIAPGDSPGVNLPTIAEPASLLLFGAAGSAALVNWPRRRQAARTPRLRSAA